MKVSFNSEHPLNAALRPVMSTITTANFDAALKAYQQVLEYELIETNTLSAEMAKHWGLADLSGARLAIMRPKSGAPVFVRFVEIKPAKPRGPSCGWFALEICVEDVEELYQRLLGDKNFTPFAQPMPLAFTDRVYPMQCKGPSGEILYLNQVRGSLPDIDLPIAQSYVDHLFIAILSASDMEASAEFYCDVLGMAVNERHEIAYKTINRVHGLPLDTLHKLATLGGPRHVGLEIDQYPGLANSPRPVTEESITEGILMVSFAAQTLDVKNDDIIAPPQAFKSTPYKGARSMVLLGPSAELMELIELPL